MTSGGQGHPRPILIGQVGSWVRIQGLQGAPQLNGLEAKVQSYDEAWPTSVWPWCARAL